MVADALKSIYNNHARQDAATGWRNIYACKIVPYHAQDKQAQPEHRLFPAGDGRVHAQRLLRVQPQEQEEEEKKQMQ